MTEALSIMPTNEAADQPLVKYGAPHGLPIDHVSIEPEHIDTSEGVFAVNDRRETPYSERQIDVNSILENIANFTKVDPEIAQMSFKARFKKDMTERKLTQR